MKYLKKYQIFCEECDGGGTATANASNTAGMGAVVASQPGTFPGTTGTTGSGDVGSTLGVYQKTPAKKRKKGTVSEVSDLRDLKDEKTKKSS